MSATILWADDEIDLLKPHIMFLRSKGYEPVTVNNGRDALELVESRHFDLVILDENMPGITGLETLQRIKEIRPQTPVIMITKSEEENIMDQAVGSCRSRRICIARSLCRRRLLPTISRNSAD